MSKKALQEIIAKQQGASIKEASATINAFTQGVEELLSLGIDVSLIGFGKFDVKEVAARVGRNPSTGEPMNIPKKNAVRFKAGSKLKSAVQA